MSSKSSDLAGSGYSLENLSIVLVDTRTPANIGATARCMMNMGLSRLVLVNPPDDPGREAHKLAAGADAVLNSAVIRPSLRDAVSDQGLVIGVSRHRGRMRRNIRTPREMAEQALQLLIGNKVSLVFGNEVNGLDRGDLAQCHEFISIPSSDAFPSLNLSQAVLVVAYEFSVAAAGAGTAKIKAAELAADGDVEQFYAHLQKTLEAVGFLDQDHPERMMFSLRQLFGRARMNERDVSILRGILRNIERKIVP